MLGSINWDAINAVSNIFMAIATFIAVLTSLYFSRLSYKSNAKTFFEIEKIGMYEKYKFILVNLGFVKIQIIAFRLIIDQFGWKHKHIAVVNQKIGEDLDSSQHYMKVVKTEDINKSLLELGKKNGDKIKLRYVFMDSRNKFHTKTLKFQVYEEPEISLQLNSSKSPK